MQNTKEKIYFNFSYQALKLLGDGLYSNPWTAISELIANGIDAEATKIFLFINMINKQSSTIEIFDNGYGMNYNDLAVKYALIGKNKRIDEDINEDRRDTIIGRKGIGKLAALYLASTYYLISKTNNENNSWCFDMNNILGDEIPSLKKVKRIQVEAERHWQTCKTGTLVKLVNVDLKNIGEQTIEGLKARIADYYTFNEKNMEIFIALKQNPKDKIVFEKAEKQIAFKNFYAFFNLTDKDFSDKLSREILLKTNFSEMMPNTRKIIEATKEVYYRKCPTRILNNVFQTSGEQKFNFENGIPSASVFNYELNGWIGIHSTIEKREAKLNDKIFIRNKAYQPNRLRLYVRNKLAVENFLDYIRSTQAFSKYIEGEIHFDILDNNNLPDIATADRQDYRENNDRIQKLIEILKPIINALIKTRIEIGHQIRIEEDNYRKEKEAKQAEQAEKAQDDARNAWAAKDKAEAHSKKVEKELEQEKKQSIFQRSIIGREKEQIMGLQHQIKHSASRIKTNVSNLYDYLGNNSKSILNEIIIKHLSTISSESVNIETIAKYVTNANFDLKATEINEDIVRFTQEYLNEIYALLEKKYPKITIKNANNIIHTMEFRPLEVSSMIDNFVHNAKKAEADTITFTYSKQGDKLEFDVSDDGNGILQKDIPKIFDFGFTTTDGSGIGLFIVKRCVENLNGRIEVVSNEKKGTTFRITI